MPLPTVTDLKIHLNMDVDDNTHDTELGDMLDAAVDVVADIVGPLEPGTVTEIHRGVSSGLLVLRRMPAAALVSVSTRSGTTITPLTLADYELDTATGIVRVASGGGFVGTFVVVYSTGRDTLPAAIRLAVLVIGGHLWETQRMPGQTSDRPAGFGGVDGLPDATTGMGSGFAIPSRAQELLQPYIFPVIA